MIAFSTESSNATISARPMNHSQNTLVPEDRVHVAVEELAGVAQERGVLGRGR